MSCQSSPALPPLIPLPPSAIRFSVAHNALLNAPGVQLEEELACADPMIAFPPVPPALAVSRSPVPPEYSSAATVGVVPLQVIVIELAPALEIVWTWK